MWLYVYGNVYRIYIIIQKYWLSFENCHMIGNHTGKLKTKRIKMHDRNHLRKGKEKENYMNIT